MLDKREWARRHCDHVRLALMREPRGHAAMNGAVLKSRPSPRLTRDCSSCTPTGTASCLGMP